MKDLLTMICALVLFTASLALMSVVQADETIRDDEGRSRVVVRDRGSQKALINDKGEKIGYGVRRGDSWVYFVEGDRVSVTEDD